MSKKCYWLFFLDFVNVYFGLKFLFFFDYVVIDVMNVSILIDVLVLDSVVFYVLDVFWVGDDIFFVDLRYLVSYLKIFVEWEEFILIDVLGILLEFCMLELDVLKSVYK